MTDHLLHILGPLDIPHVGPRKVRVYVPPTRDPAAPRPVIYVFDGQNLFNDEPSFAGGWHLHTTAHRLARSSGRAPVIVGIDHGNGERIHELGPWHTGRGGGRTDALLDWMATSLMPRIRADFKVSGEPAQVGVGGSSLGGLAALYAHFKRPELFGLVMAMSPSLWLSQGKIFDVVAATSKPWTSKIYLDAGGLEGGGAMLKSAQRMVDHLRSRGWDDGSLKWVAAKRGGHSEKHWRRRAPGALSFLFPGGGVAKKSRKKKAG